MKGNRQIKSDRERKKEVGEREEQRGQHTRREIMWQKEIKKDDLRDIEIDRQKDR